MRNLERPLPLPTSGLAFHVALRALPSWYPTRWTAIAHVLKAVHNLTHSARDSGTLALV
jgi:hypothetical protein